MSFIALGVTGTVSAATAIAGASALAGVGMGAAQMSSANKAQKRSQQELERQAKNSPLYRPSKEIGDYYKEAKTRYAQNPFTTPFYLENLKQSERSAVQALGALQSRGAAIGGVSRINRILQDSKNRNIATAMQEKNMDLARLGQAAQMQNRENQQAFDINKMTPYNRQLQLEQMKAQAAGERYNAGMQMIGSGLSNAASYGVASAYNNPDGLNRIKTNQQSGINLAKNDAMLNEFNATRGKLNPNFIPNARGVNPQQSDFMKNMSNWNASRSLKD
jgi:hypothetical protein